MMNDEVSRARPRAVSRRQPMYQRSWRGPLARCGMALLACVLPCLAQEATQSASADHPPWETAQQTPRLNDEEDTPRGCNTPGFSLHGSLTNDNRRTSGLVLSEGGYAPPVQQGQAALRVENVLCERVHLELSGWYSLHDISIFKENRFHARGIYQGLPGVTLYGGFAYYDNPEGLYTSRSFYTMAGAEYPSFWGTTVQADYLHDIHESGDWLTVMVSKTHRLGATRNGAVFNYRHGLGATGTRSLPGDTDTPSITGIPSVFYRGSVEILDGPLVWYVEASPHVSFVSEATGVPKRHFLVAAGVRLEVP
jgi:hypothetical protein